MRSEYPHLLTLGIAPSEVYAIIDKANLETPDITYALAQLINAGELSVAHINKPGRCAVEVCWEHAGRITCRTYQVRARSDKQAARKGRSIAKNICHQRPT